jgi:hypothetical protein
MGWGGREVVLCESTGEWFEEEVSLSWKGELHVV